MDKTNELNLVEILNGAPKGTPLYSPIFGEVTLLGVDTICELNFPIAVKDIAGFTQFFSLNGEINVNYPDAECLLFPSKEVRTWRGFVAPWEKEPVCEDVMPGHKPFDKVLVRDHVKEKWCVDFYGFFDDTKLFPHQCVSKGWDYVLPYEGNEDKLGKVTP